MTLEEYDTALKAWNEKLHETYAAKRRAEADIQRLKRDLIASRLAVADAQLHLAAVEGRIESHRKVKPKKPEPRY